MPNIQIDYSPNLSDVVASTRLADVIHQATVDCNVFPTWGIRTFARAAEHSRVGDGKPGNGFIQIMIRIAPGRDVATRQRVAKALFEAVVAVLEPTFQQRSLGLQLEVQEFDPPLVLNRTNLNASG
jgi:5-carboxymethyl-2-hydroxymuconate isomerase